MQKHSAPENITDIPTRDRLRGSLLAGAVGDALGAPVEFMRLTDIQKEFGPDGIADYVPCYGRLGAITDDTQMTLFTADGLLRAYYSAAAFAVILHAILCNLPLETGIRRAEKLLKDDPDAEETRRALALGVEQARLAIPPQKAIAKIGEAWVGEEALGVAVYW